MVDHLPQLYYIAVATKPHPVLERIKQRVAMNNEHITILGEKENRDIGWQANQNFGVKLNEVYKFIHRTELNDNDIILFTDAYDVAYCGNMAEIIHRFTLFNKPIVFGSEKYCNPDESRSIEYTMKNTEFPYLNSGMFIGRAWALKQCMNGYEYNDKEDDQRYWTTKFLNNPDLIELDYNNAIFLNTVDIDMNQFIWNGQFGRYKLNNPIFIHVNGPDKRLIDQLV